MALLPGGCSSGEETTGDSPATTPTGSTMSPTPAPTPTTEPEPEPSPTPTTPTALGSADFRVPFVMEPDADGRLRLDSESGGNEVIFKAGSNDWLVFTTAGEDTIEDWVSHVQRVNAGRGNGQ
ncbi:MAG: hypothetical protein R3320_11380 [Nitriliruptorales bacterium]|nr:hypothetical protein [Nitriliruptorales bacterium]